MTSSAETPNPETNKRGTARVTRREVLIGLLSVGGGALIGGGAYALLNNEPTHSAASVKPSNSPSPTPSPEISPAPTASATEWISKERQARELGPRNPDKTTAELDNMTPKDFAQWIRDWNELFYDAEGGIELKDGSMPDLLFASRCLNEFSTQYQSSLERFGKSGDRRHIYAALGNKVKASFYEQMALKADALAADPSTRVPFFIVKKDYPIEINHSHDYGLYDFSVAALDGNSPNTLKSPENTLGIELGLSGPGATFHFQVFPVSSLRRPGITVWQPVLIENPVGFATL